jgi:hypothetical protein
MVSSSQADSIVEHTRSTFATRLFRQRWSLQVTFYTLSKDHYLVALKCFNGLLQGIKKYSLVKESISEFDQLAWRIGLRREVARAAALG